MELLRPEDIADAVSYIVTRDRRVGWLSTRSSCAPPSRPGDGAEARFGRPALHHGGRAAHHGVHRPGPPRAAVDVRGVLAGRRQTGRGGAVPLPVLRQTGCAVRRVGLPLLRPAVRTARRAAGVRLRDRAQNAERGPRGRRRAALPRTGVPGLGDYGGRGLVVRSPEPVDFHPTHKTVNVVPVDSLLDAAASATVATQTVGVYPGHRKVALCDRLAGAGVQRVVNLGSALSGSIGGPYDAMYPLHRFVSWVVDDDA
ncbi:acyl-CoA reductase [Streptomyces olivochromogenes]